MLRLLKTSLISLSLLVLTAGIFSPVAFAAGGSGCTKSFFAIPTWYKYLPLSAAPECNIVTGDLGGKVFILVLMAVIEILLTLAGFIAVGYIIFGSFKFILSQGDPQKVVGARTTILNAVIGLIIAIIGSQIVSFIAGKLAT